MRKTAEWWREYTTDLTPGYADLIATESRAVIIHSLSFIINGLLQTEDYARAIMMGPLPVDASNTRLLEVRMKRQWYVLEREQPPQIEILLDESALYRQIGGPEVLRDQLKHVLVMSELSFMTIRVIPFNYYKYLHTFDTHLCALDGAYTDGAVYLEEIYGMNQQKGRVVLGYYNSVFSQLRARALSEEDTRKLIQGCVVKLEKEMAARTRKRAA